ncbi:MAG: DUF4249 domain-containing protein [Bacteroidales bacterium]|nr:DUF4249 domain-containing protein [Bacteroidales bacterium]
MNRSKSKIIILMMILTGIFSCQEIFEPQLNVDRQYMVVDGMITNDYGPHYIRLFYTKPLTDIDAYNMVTDATVDILDNQGNVVRLLEINKGIYETPSDFKGEVGVEYILDIITDDGAHFQSDPQILPQPVVLDSLYALLGIEPFYYVSEHTGRLTKVDMDVLNVFASVSEPSYDFPKFRFTSEAYLQYTQTSTELSNTGEIIDQVTFYCWLKRNNIDFVGTDIGEFTIPYEARSHRVAMVPRGVHPMRFLNFPEGIYTDVRVVFNRFLSLNDDAYDFHVKKNEQIRGQGGLFDPVVTQINGNIKCISDPSVLVLGFFEASYDLGLFVYKIHQPNFLASYEIQFIDYFEPYSPAGCVTSEPPDFWIY